MTQIITDEDRRQAERSRLYAAQEAIRCDWLKRCDDCGETLTIDNQGVMCPDGAYICRDCLNAGRH